MKFRSKTALAGLWLALGILFGDRPCFGSSSFEPVVGDPMIEHWRWRTFPQLSGLDTLCATERKDGTVWFGTANGLWSYDGIEWVGHSTNEILGRIVTALCCHTNGTLYVGGGWGISQLSKGNWTRLLSGPANFFGDIRKIAIGSDGSLWAATSAGALRRQHSTWTLYTDPTTSERIRRGQRFSLMVKIELLPEAVVGRFSSGSLPFNGCDFSDVCADSQGRIWFGSSGGEVLCYGPASSQSNIRSDTGQGSWSIYNRDNGLGPGIVTSILATKDGTIWAVHASSEQAEVFDGKNWQPIRLPFLLPALDLGDAGGKLIQTGDGVVWLAARYMLFAYRSGKWQKYEQTDIAIPSTRNVIMQTADGALWFMGPDGEIHRVDYQTPRWLTYEDLNFQWESSAGAQWFLHRDGRVIVQDGGRWTSFGVEDDLMDTPVALLGTRRGEIWVAGSHQRIAATARFDGKKWTRYLHEDFSCGIDWRAMFESSDGSVWIGAFVDTDGPEKHRDGILQFRDGVWTHHHQPGRSPHPDEVENLATLLPASRNPNHPIEKFICFGESRDGKIWVGRNILAFYDGKKWQEPPPSGTRFEVIETMLTARSGDLWIGSRQQGALRYDGGKWQHFQGKGGLVANSIRSLAETTDGTIWAATDRGFSRYDGVTWMPDVLPEELNLPHEGGNLKASPSGKLWINRFTREWTLRFWGKAKPVSSNADFRTICHQFSGKPPRTVITGGPAIVAQPGNVSILWGGVVSWREPKDSRLQFSFRVDDQPWSPYTSDGGHSFFSLPSGRHHFEVRARDNDFNVDPHPATLDFVVMPPVWRQGWFILLMILLGGLTATQSIRVFLERGRLRRANRALSAEVKDRERAEEEIRNLNAGLERHVQERTAQLEAANKELEAFSYSVSHDLRTPLRTIDGFSRALLEDYADKLDAEGKDFLETIRSASQRMGQLIDDMLRLAQIKRSEMHWTEVNLSRMAAQIAGELKKMEPARQVEFIIAPDLVASGDAALLRIMLENILGNAWKYTSKKPVARIEFGRNETAKGQTYFVRDNGCGFDMEYVHKLFGAFQRLHEGTEFPGTGVGLASVQRVIQRHGGAVWIEGQVGVGATLYFTLPAKRQNSRSA